MLIVNKTYRIVDDENDTVINKGEMNIYVKTG